MRRGRNKGLLLILAIVLSVSAFAHAELTGFNMVVLDDFSGSVHIAGKAAISGSVTGSLGVGSGIGKASTDTNLLVGGNISSGVTTIEAGNGAVGGKVSTSVNLNGSYSGRTIYQNDSSVKGQINALAAELAGTSSYFAGFDGTDLLASDISSNKLNLNTQGLSDFVVFDVWNDVLSYQNLELNLQANTTQTIVFNVYGNDIDFKAKLLDGFANGTTYRDKVVWNFIDATDVDFASENFGTVLAQYATVHSKNNFNGGVYVSSLDIQGEVHLPLYNGILPPPTVPAPPAMILASGGIAVVSRIRRRISA